MERMIRIIIRIANLAALFLYFCYKIIVSGWIVGLAVLRGSRGENGVMIEYSPKVTSEWGLVLLFSLISMTPGSLSVDISDDRQIIHVHLLDKAGIDDFHSVTGKIERMLIRIFT
jgi:multisubunit Na+/H+ antiporter MnhE subunit